MTTYNTFHSLTCPLSQLFLTLGSFPSEKLGTRSEFGNPSCMYTSDVKAIWKYSFDCSANLARGMVTLSVTPPADAPVGKYSLSANTGRGKTPLGTLVVLFNPWCSGEYLNDKKEKNVTHMHHNRCETYLCRCLHRSTQRNPELTLELF